MKAFKGVMKMPVRGSSNTRTMKNLFYILLARLLTGTFQRNVLPLTLMTFPICLPFVCLKAIYKYSLKMKHLICFLFKSMD